jgi:hypothetical protein
VESSCKLGNEPSGSIKCWELPNGCTTCGLSSGVQLHIVSVISKYYGYAKVLIIGRGSFIEVMKSKGPKIGPSGTPCSIVPQLG